MSLSLAAPQSTGVALVVVTYRPSSSFVESIRSSAEQFELVVLVDNSGRVQPDLQGLDPRKFDVIFNQANVGLGRALNIGCERAMELGFEWSLTLDQDTELLPGFLRGMLLAWEKTDDLTALLGSNYFNNSRSTYKIPVAELPTVSRQVTVITSGSLMHLPTWSQLGGFRNDYFIDSIDHEFCLRVRRAGFVVAINAQAGMVHHIGDKLEYQSVIARFAPYRHNIWRKYTSTRNTFRTIIDYAAIEPLWCARKALGLAFECAAIIVLEPYKLSRLKAFFLGLLHASLGRLGPVPETILNLESQ